MTIYAGFGQAIDTSLAVAGMIGDIPSSWSRQGIRIWRGPDMPNRDMPLYARADDVLRFSAAGVATYLCRPDDIEVRACPGSDPEWVSALLVATALPAALWMQGKFVLHAAAVVPYGASHAIAIAGSSGAGKSVLAKQLLQRGASLLADDSIALQFMDSEIIASGLPGGIHSRTGQDGERRFDAVPPDRSVLAAPLGAVIILNGFADAFEHAALGKLAAIEHLLIHQHRPRIPAVLGQVGPVLAQAANIAIQVPVSIWRRIEGDVPLSQIEQDLLTAMA